MKIKTAELTGPALDWAVGYIQCFFATGGKPILSRDLMAAAIRNGMASPSTDWSQGGPIIEREKIRLVFRDLGADSYWFAEAFEAYNGNQYISGSGPTLLIAAMRCYVASRLGAEVDVPEELT